MEGFEIYSYQQGLLWPRKNFYTEELHITYTCRY